MIFSFACNLYVAPVRERGLKWYTAHNAFYVASRSREGAWIEILPARRIAKRLRVAPVRERGLK